VVKKDLKTTTKKTKKPWPTKKAMAQIYANKLWGTNNTPFYSGYGSHHQEIVNPYIEAVRFFLATFKNPINICDLGCGDFNVGKELVKYTKNYIAIDIVKDLIIYNKEKFKYPNLEFHCLDITVDNLPSTDCILLRQVLQHLSNEEIHTILNKLPNYKYVIITEHIPQGDFIPNSNIISGQGTRLKKQSGVNVLARPFNLKVVEERKIASVILKNKKECIETTLYHMH